MMRDTITPAAPAASASPSLYRLLADYWNLYDEFIIASDRADELKKTAQKDEADAAEFAASSKLSDASCAILRFLPRTRAESEVKARFVDYVAMSSNGLFDDELDALLSTLPFLFHFDRRATS